MRSFPAKLPARFEYEFVGIIYLLATVFFFRSVLFGNATFPVDLIDMDYPRFVFLSKWIHQFLIPLWDPHIGFGVPLAGQMGCQTFYPPLYLMVLLGGATPGIRVVEWGTISHLALAALGGYTLCRALNLSRGACFIAGIVFAFGGFFPLRMFHGGWVETAAWFPFALAAWLRFLEARRLCFAAWMSVVLLIMLLAGLWQQVMYSMYFLLFWAAWESTNSFIRGTRARIAWLPLVTVFVACGAALVSDSCELLPTYEFAKQTVRQKLTYEESASTGLRPSDLPSILYAGMFSGKDGEGQWNARRANGSIRDYYPGTVTLILLLYNLVLLVKSPDRNQIFLWVALILFAAASFGTLTPVFWILYKLAPGFSFFRRSSALYYFPVLAASVLCAYSVNDIFCRRPVLSLRAVRWVAISLAFINGLAAIGLRSGLECRGALIYSAAFATFALLLYAVDRVPARKFLPLWLLAGVCFGDLYYFHGVQFSFVIRNFEYPSLAGNPILGNAPSDPYRVALAPLGGYWDNLGDIAGFENPGGYLLFRLKRYQDYFARIQGPESPLLAAANVRYLLTSSELMQAGRPRVALAPTENRVQIPSGPAGPPAYVSAAEMAGGLKLLRNVNATPRYYFSSSMKVVNDDREMLNRMSDIEFARNRAALLETNIGIKVDDCSADKVNVLNYSPNSVRLSVVSHGNCLLMATDTYQPDWHAYINGLRAPVYVANSVFRASLIPSGPHTVDLRFEPFSLWAGMAVSAGAGLFLLGIYWRCRRAAEHYLADESRG